MSDGDGAQELLPPALLARLETLQLRTRRRLAGRFAGEHRALAHGSSVDFADYREYHPGDDFRRIDYALYARLGVLLVRLFEAEEDVHLRLLVDTSGSMAVGGKLRHASRLAAALGFVALVRRDPVTVHTFAGGTPSPRFSGRGALAALLEHLGGLQAGGETRVAAAATDLLARSGRSGLTIVLSDLLAEDWDAGLGRLPVRGSDTAVVHVLAGEDLEPAAAGDVELVDAESGRRVPVTLTEEAVRRYGRRAREWADRVALRCAHLGMAYARTFPDDDVEALLLGGWRRAGILR